MLQDLSSAAVADGCLRLGIAPRCAQVRPVVAGSAFNGKAIPVRHHGGVDIFFEAIERAERGDVLVIDNEQRRDEGCIGDLVCLEAKNAGIAGIVVWGCHRDTAEISNMGLPVFSLGAFPVGPTRNEPRPYGAFDFAAIGGFQVTAADYVVADDDGIVVFPAARCTEVAESAAIVRDTERAQARKSVDGHSLREQFRFKDYLELRARTEGYSLGEHVKSLGLNI